MNNSISFSRAFNASLFVLAATGLCAASFYSSSFNSHPARVPTSKERLAAAVAELQVSPANRALREEIIKLAQRAKPEIPEAARRGFDRAFSLSRGDQKQMREAAFEYKRVLRIAPWWPEPYYQLGVVSQALGGSICAAHAFELCLLADPKGRHAMATQDSLRSIEESGNQNEDCIECGQACVLHGKECCGACECVGGKFPNTYCKETW